MYIYDKKQYQQHKSIISYRFIFLCISILLTLIILIIRIFYLQIINSKKLIYEGNMRSLRIQTIPIERGMISDRYGKLLAVSIPVYAIWANPFELHHNNKTIDIHDIRWKKLANALLMPIEQLFSRIHMNSRKHFIYLARQVSLNLGQYIYELKLPGIYLQKESRRFYPSGKMISHLVGVTNIDNKGIEGIEKSFDIELTGSPGKRIVRKDKLGRVIEDILFIHGHDSNNITLSIDERLQMLVYRELNNAVSYNKAESGTAILVDVNTGEILALANSPSYNPNTLYKATINTMRNRAITDIFEPGSTVKPIVVMTALHQGIIQKNSILNTLPYTVNGYQIKDVTCYTTLSITGILQKSSNVGISKLALSIPFSKLIETYSQFGLGSITHTGLIGESHGLLYPVYKRKWSDIDKVIFSYGYGLMVTPIQLARVYAAIGSLGILRPLSIRKVNNPVSGIQIFPKSLVRTVIDMMESVSLPGGVGTKAAIKGYRIAIKTGTAKKVINGHYINQYIAYTAGIAPASNPRFALVIVINNPKGKEYYGGAIAAPVFRIIMSNVFRIMNIKPDVSL